MSTDKLNKKSFISTATAAILIFLMASSAFLVFSNSAAITVKAQTTTGQTTTDQTSIPSNLLQYEWIEPGGNPYDTYYSDGPAPSSASIQWKCEIPGVSGGIYAFDDMVFVMTLTATYAIDPGTGNIIWTSPIVSPYGSICKIDDNYMMIGTTCVYTANGTQVWVAPPSFTVTLEATPWTSGVTYVPELKMFVSSIYGWSLPDPSKPPTLAWNRTSEIDAGGFFGNWAFYGDGMVFSCLGDGWLRALNATTGDQIWQTPTTEVSGFQFGASYYDGMIIQGDLADNMRAWNATTGQLIWTYNPGSYYGFWASATAAAYGMVYEQNQDTYLYAINATTGQLVWRAKGPGVGYSGELVVGDGKIYYQSGDSQYRDPTTGTYGYDEYDCLNATTGQLIWSLPLGNGCPYNSQCIAYGNLYICPSNSTAVPGAWNYFTYGLGSLGELWCIGSQPSNWSNFLGNPSLAGEGDGPTNLALKWTFQTNGQVLSSPTLVNGLCYFGSQDNNIYAINANTGTEIWSFKTGFDVRSSQAVVNGKLYTGADDGNIYCLDAATGTVLWKTYAGGITNSLLGAGLVNIRSSPIVVGGKVYVGSLDGNLYCLDANSGAVLWEFQTGGQILATPAVDDNAVYICSCTQPVNGTVYKLDANTGSVIWQLGIPYELTATPAYTAGGSSGNYLLASPTVAAGMVFVRNGYLDNYAVNATTGAIIWDYTAMVNPLGYAIGQAGGVIQIGTPLYAYGAIYINDYYGISCLNATDGSRIWYSYLSREDLASPTYAYGRIYVVTEARVIYVLNAWTGAKLSYYVAGAQMRSSPTPYNGNLYVGCCDWNVYCFGDSRIMSAQPATVASSSVSSLQAQSPSIITPETPATASSTPTIAYVTLIVAVAIVATAAVALVLMFRKRK